MPENRTRAEQTADAKLRERLAPKGTLERARSARDVQRLEVEEGDAAVRQSVRGRPVDDASWPDEHDEPERNRAEVD